MSAQSNIPFLCLVFSNVWFIDAWNAPLEAIGSISCMETFMEVSLKYIFGTRCIDQVIVFLSFENKP